MPTVNVKSGVVLPTWLAVEIKQLLTLAGEDACLVDSVARSPREQAQAMDHNCRTTGAAKQYGLYAPAGDQVIAVWEQTQDQPWTKRIDAMTAKIMELGPGNVSHHCLGPDSNRGVVDIAQSSIKDGDRFRSVCGTSPRVAKILVEDYNGCYHLELYQQLPQSQTM